MTVVVYLIGALLVIAGGAFIGTGVPIVRLEIGWTEIIGGAVAGSAGFVILAIGVVLTKLQDLERALLGFNMAAALRGSPDGTAAEWTPPDGSRPFAPHPLAPPVLHPADAGPSHAVPALEEEPLVEPEPPLDEAPLHHEPVFAEHPAAVVPVAEEPAAHELDEGAPALAAREDHAPPVQPVEPVVSAVLPAEAAAEPLLVPPSDPARGRPNFLASFLARRNLAAERATPRREEPANEPVFAPHEPDVRAAPRTSIDLSSGWDEPEPRDPAPAEEVHPLRGGYHPAEEPSDEFAPDEAPADADHDHVPGSDEPAEEGDQAPPVAEAEGHGAPPEPDPAAPVVVGRYNAGSASYIMYSNGMIEVETDSGTHQFASMQELKAFIERRDAARV